MAQWLADSRIIAERKVPFTEALGRADDAALEAEDRWRYGSREDRPAALRDYRAARREALRIVKED
jgi:hypothetical protein